MWIQCVLFAGAPLCFIGRFKEGAVFYCIIALAGVLQSCIGLALPANCLIITYMYCILYVKCITDKQIQSGERVATVDGQIVAGKHIFPKADFPFERCGGFALSLISYKSGFVCIRRLVSQVALIVYTVVEKWQSLSHTNHLVYRVVIYAVYSNHHLQCVNIIV